MISSVNNEKIKYICKLKDKKEQIASGLFIIEGLHQVEEAKKNGYLEEVIVLDDFDFDYPQITRVTTNVMKKITDLASTPKIIGIVKNIKPGTIKGKVLVLDRISNPGNLGTILRSAAAFNVDTIVISENSVSLYNPKVLRATEGLIFSLNIINDANLKEILSYLKEDNYKIYSTNVENGTNLKDIKFSNKTCIIMGSEGNGVDKEIEKFASEYLYIPMNEKCESLNVGVATSIILYELSSK